MPAARFAPSPTSALHVGNLRTAVVAALLADATGHRFLLRVEDLDQARVSAAPGVARGQLEDLRQLGIGWHGDVWWQSQRTQHYTRALADLPVYECFCSRKDIAAAAQAPNGPDGLRPYPGTCRDLSPAERAERQRVRSPALRVRADAARVSIDDRYVGRYSAVVDDFVVRRSDGTFAYNLASVVDDAASNVTQICRGDDLLSSAPRQAWLAQRLGADAPRYAHVGLVTNRDGRRLAKRDGAVTLADLAAAGWSTQRVLGWIGRSLGYDVPAEATLGDIAARFDPDRPVPAVVFDAGLPENAH